MTAIVTIVLTIFALFYIGMRVSPSSIQNRAVSKISDFAEEWLMGNGYYYFLRPGLSNTWFWEGLLKDFNSHPLNYVEVGFLGSIELKQTELLNLIREKVKEFDLQIRMSQGLDIEE